MKKRIDISKCSCGSSEIGIVGVPAMALTGRKASCFIRCKKCLFTVMSNDLSKASSEKLAGFWNYLQRAKTTGAFGNRKQTFLRRIAPHLSSKLKTVCFSEIFSVLPGRNGALEPTDR